MNKEIHDNHAHMEFLTNFKEFYSNWVFQPKNVWGRKEYLNIPCSIGVSSHPDLKVNQLNSMQHLPNPGKEKSKFYTKRFYFFYSTSTFGFLPLHSSTIAINLSKVIRNINYCRSYIKFWYLINHYSLFMTRFDHQ